jgi:hypothetical protein
MSMWTAIAFIAIAGIAGEAYRHYTRNRGRAGGKGLSELNERLDHLEAELRDRIETLERIVTDRIDDAAKGFCARALPEAPPGAERSRPWSRHPAE